MHRPDDGPELAALGRRYLADTAPYRGDAPYFVDKMPNNFRHLGLIAAMLPEAILVDSRRHPMACRFSIYKQNFARGQVFGYGLDTLAVYYRNYVAMMRHWQSVLPGRVHRVVYERMVDDTDRVVRTASAEQVRQPIYQSAKSHWRQYESHLAPLASGLGDVLEVWEDSVVELP